MLKSLRRTKAQLGYKWWRIKRAVRSRLSTVNEKPIIVLGNQKSGTTAIAALLAERAGLNATLDLEEMTAQDERQMHAQPQGVDAFIAHHKLEFSRDLIKEPRLTFVFPQLRRRFPHARFVFIIRDPRDNIRSILDRLNLPCNPTTDDTQSFDHVDPVWQQVIDGRWMGIPRDTYIETLSHRWNQTAINYLEAPDHALLVRYEDFKADKAGVIDELVSDLALEAVTPIHDKLDVQYQPRGKRRGQPREEVFDQATLQTIGDICGDNMKHFGYSTSDI